MPHVTTHDVDFLEHYVRSTVWSYGYNGSLSFSNDPATLDHFEYVEEETLADFNSGPHALDNHACNSEFLEHEKWLLCMLAEIETILPFGDSILERRRSELLTLIRNELSRLQTHKHAEWLRQRHAVDRCEKAGEMKDWLARLLSRPGIEDAMDAAADRAKNATSPVMSDIWDAPVLKNLQHNGRPFIYGPAGEGRYVFSLSVDSFNPFQSKEAKQNVSVTGVYMVCLNLPPHLRYLPENIYLVGIIP
ncbi:hypothetical protein FKP32DRAFT_1572301, partial [Trametes sanguinea]